MVLLLWSCFWRPICERHQPCGLPIQLFSLLLVWLFLLPLWVWLSLCQSCSFVSPLFGDNRQCLLRWRYSDCCRRSLFDLAEIAEARKSHGMYTQNCPESPR